MDGHERIQGLKGSWEWLSFATTLPATPVPLSSISAGYLAMGGRCVLTGFSGINPFGGSGHVDIYDGQDTTGVSVWRIPVAANAVVSTSLPGRGVLLEIGCFVNPVGVTFNGSALLIPLWDYEWSPPG